MGFLKHWKNFFLGPFCISGKEDWLTSYILNTNVLGYVLTYSSNILLQHVTICCGNILLQTSQLWHPFVVSPFSRSEVQGAWLAALFRCQSACVLIWRLWGYLLFPHLFQAHSVVGRIHFLLTVSTWLFPSWNQLLESFSCLVCLWLLLLHLSDSSQESSLLLRAHVIRMGSPNNPE